MNNFSLTKLAALLRPRKAVAGLLAGTLVLAGLLAGHAAYAANTNPTITICHATGNGGYVTNTPSINSHSGAPNGHDNHDNDIIPSYQYVDDNGATQTYAGVNWDATGQAIWNNNCVVPTIPTTATLIVKKHVINDNGGTAAASAFTMQVTGTNASLTSFSGDESGTSVTLDAGTYSVDEAAASGYTKSIGAGCSGSIAAGATVTCTITNDDDAQPAATGTLIIKKVVVNNNGGTATSSDFSFVLDDGASTQFEADGQNEVVVSAGMHSVSEVSATGYTASYENCDDVDVPAGQSATCTITNDDNDPGVRTGTLVVQKVVINDNGGTATSSDFSFQVDGGTAVAFEADGQNEFTLGAGVHSVSEVAATGYTAQYDNCSEVEVVVGQTVTCTITNNDNDPGQHRFTLTVTTSGDGEGSANGEEGEGISCDSTVPDSDCAETYPEGTVVTLTASPKEGSSFEDSWSGACSGNNPTCQITMTGDMSVNANFTIPSSNGGGGGGGGGGRRSGGNSNDSGEVLGASTGPGEVLAAETPVGAPNTGAGGVATGGMLGAILLLAGTLGVGVTRKARA